MSTAPSGQSTTSDLSAPPEKLSAFLARVLDQLSLSAWLPAAFLATSLAILTRLRMQENLDLAEAARALVRDPVALLIVTIPVVILTTLVTQSFSFEAIRALEGYWHRRWLLGWAHTGLTRFRLGRKRAIAARLPDLRDRAFSTARARMVREGVPRRVVDAIETELNGGKRVKLDPQEDLQRDELAWRDFGDPVEVARFDRLILALQDYPEDGLIMPTQLGNLMRATESRLQNAAGDVSSFGLRCIEWASSLAQGQAVLKQVAGVVA